MAYRSGLPIDKVATSGMYKLFLIPFCKHSLINLHIKSTGPGLAFIVYPEGIAMMPVSPLWSILFFVMLLTLGLDSQFAMMETVISAISDEFKILRKHKIAFTAAVCIIFFLIGLPQCSRGGIYVMQLFDNYSAGYSLMIVSFFELIAIAWIYGNSSVMLPVIND